MPENLLCNQIIDSVMAINNETSRIIELNSNIVADNDNISMEIDTSKVFSLDIMRDIDIESQMFNIDQKVYEDNTEISSKRQTIVLALQHNNFDIETLARNMSIVIDDDENLS
ncbi:8269_t:CDS:1 [Scutellospora calospora]|uniref:8269_t:CDS:1 n=1 Tax=Scutellospora calospora TaxID=85575 RepID=A0ACA9MEN9_9GLOM|nr:8269_t:CDS:1 [Scutellospora calospora]